MSFDIDFLDFKLAGPSICFFSLLEIATDNTSQFKPEPMSRYSAMLPLPLEETTLRTFFLCGRMPNDSTEHSSLLSLDRDLYCIV